MKNGYSIENGLKELYEAIYRPIYNPGGVIVPVVFTFFD